MMDKGRGDGEACLIPMKEKGKEELNRKSLTLQQICKELSASPLGIHPLEESYIEQ